MQLRVRHMTTYRYDGLVEASYSEARLTPMTLAEQFVRHSRLDITPTPWTQEYRDYWNTEVSAFEIADPHDELLVVATSTVDTASPAIAASSVSWRELHDLDTQDQFCEYLAQSDATRPHEDLLALAQSWRDDASTPADFVSIACARVRSLERLVAATHVSATAREAWESGAGVAHDLTHVAIGALRHAGIPARFVSGYRHPSAAPEVGEAVVTEHHAWLEWWAGSWRGHDVAFAEAPADRHVVLAKGRDVTDVPPLRGIYATSGPTRVDVGVEITRLA